MINENANLLYDKKSDEALKGSEEYFNNVLFFGMH